MDTIAGCSRYLDAEFLWCMTHDAVIHQGEPVEEGPATPGVCHVAILVVGNDDDEDWVPAQPCDVVLAEVSVISPRLYQIQVQR